MSSYIERGAVKVIEIIGISSDSFEDAVDQAVAKAAETLEGITGVEVSNLSGKIEGGKVVQYRAACKIAFPVR